MEQARKTCLYCSAPIEQKALGRWRTFCNTRCRQAHRRLTRKEQLREEGYQISDDDLRHLGPARHEHINPYGHYTFNVQQELQRKGLRPLRNP